MSVLEVLKSGRMEVNMAEWKGLGQNPVLTCKECGLNLPKPFFGRDENIHPKELGD